ncbi:transposase [Scleromatobacter humisilvae]|uniref:Transposase n=1 Tax=Scleromatobacter humisilvae TaxID=2897159 RepID=A0A9X1YHS1_9BURK|nr:transposase [Scleromatobacter humisilvae]MCK9686579.1 transposase [Scleromatobacter humisilvae]
MARPLRIDFPGGVYHVTSRGDRKEPIFRDDRDRDRLIAVLAQALERFDATVLAYCLMGNHYHLVVQTRRGNLSRLMRHVNGVYAQAFNRRHGLVGHLFQGRFTSIHVDRDAYLLEVCRYTELNPVRAQMVDGAADWRWSSHRAHCGLEQSPSWLDTRALHAQLLGRDALSGTERHLAARRYARFVSEGRGVPLWERELRQVVYLGDEDFVETVQARVRPAVLREREIPFAQRHAPKRALRQAASTDSRDESIRRAYVKDGMTMTEIAKAVGLSVSRVSRLMARGERVAAAPDGCGSIPVLRAQRNKQAKGKT